MKEWSNHHYVTAGGGWLCPGQDCITQHAQSVLVKSLKRIWCGSEGRHAIEERRWDICIDGNFVTAHTQVCAKSVSVWHLFGWSWNNVCGSCSLWCQLDLWPIRFLCSWFVMWPFLKSSVFCNWCSTCCHHCDVNSPWVYVCVCLQIVSLKMCECCKCQAAE